MKWHRKYLHSFLVWAIVSFLNAQDAFVIDSSLSSSLPQTLANSIEIADVNNDGYTDIIISGYDSTKFGLYIDIKLGTSGSLIQGYQTNYNTFPDTIAEYFGGIGNVSLSDVDLDGSIDIYLNGSGRSRLFLNSSGSFNLAPSWLQNMSISYSNGDFGDINMDGKPDLFIMGVTTSTDQILNKLFINVSYNFN